MSPVDKPVVLNTDPEMVAALIVTETFPVFLMEAFWEAVAWRLVVPKVKEDGIICHDGAACVPPPWMGMLRRELGSSLVIAMVPLTVVAEVGMKLSVRVWLALGASCIGVVTGLKENPVPTRLTVVISKFALPRLEIWMVCVFFCPTTTFLKSTELGTTEICGEVVEVACVTPAQPDSSELAALKSTQASGQQNFRQVPGTRDPCGEL